MDLKPKNETLSRLVCKGNKNSTRGYLHCSIHLCVDSLHLADVQ